MAEQQTLSAKQVARRIGTDAKTFRKWLRSSASPYDAVGQGQRYEFPEKDLPKITKSFKAWKGRSSSRPAIAVNGKSHPKAPADPSEHRGIPLVPRETPLNKTEFEEMRRSLSEARDEEYGTIDGEEPTEEELEELEDLELDDLDEL